MASQGKGCLILKSESVSNWPLQGWVFGKRSAKGQKPTRQWLNLPSQFRRRGRSRGVAIYVAHTKRR